MGISRARSGIVAGTGDPEQAAEECLPALLVHAPPGDDQHVHVTGRFEPAEHGGAVEVGADASCTPAHPDQPKPITPQVIAHPQVEHRVPSADGDRIGT